MTVKARIVTIRLIEKINQLPNYAERIGLSAQPAVATSNGTQQKKHEQ